MTGNLTGKYANQTINQFLGEDGAIKDTRNGCGPGLSLMSVRAWNNDGEVTTIDLTIGAMQDDQAACAFSKTTLLELASWLTEIANAMTEPKRER